MIEIHFTWYVENVQLFFSQKSQFDLVEKMKNKKRMRASHFQSSEDGKQKKNYVALNLRKWQAAVPSYSIGVLWRDLYRDFVCISLKIVLEKIRY